MKVTEILKKTIFGLSKRREYICLESNEYPQPLRVFLTGSDDFSINVTDSHLFLGYKPLIVGIPVKKDSAEPSWFEDNITCCLSFCLKENGGYSNWNGLRSVVNSIGRLALRRFEKREFEDVIVYFFEGLHGEHKLLARFHQSMNWVKEKYFTRKGSNNIDLDWDLYDQVRIAYAIPRTISIITITNGTAMNMFPTDLHGKASDNLYISSLRIGGKANEQVNNLKRLAISEIPSSWQMKAYSMGQNHIKELSSIETFPIGSVRSEQYSIPLPEEVISYKELDQIDAIDKGVHCIHLYKIKHESQVKQENKLTHIHQYFAQWREDQGLPISELSVR